MSGPPPKPKPSVLGLPPVKFARLYEYNTSPEVGTVVLACVCGAASGAILPLFSLIFGAAINSLNDSPAAIVDTVSTLALYFFLIAIGTGVLTTLEIALITRAAEKNMARLRLAYVQRLLALDAAYYDTHRVGECVTRLAEATLTVSTGLEKVASAMRYTATLICGLAIGFSKSWKLTLIIMGCAPLFAM